MGWFSKKPRAALGLCIQDRHIYWVHMVRDDNRQLVVAAHGSLPMPYGVVQSGHVYQPEVLVRSMRPLERFSDVPVFMVVPPAQSQSGQVSVDMRGVKKIKQHIQDEITAYIARSTNLLSDDAVCEYELVDYETGHADIYMTLYSRLLAAEYEGYLRQVGFSSISFISMPHAVSRLHTDTDHAYLLVDVGRRESHVMLVSAGRILNMHTVPIGEEHLLRTIQDYLHINLAEARKIHQRYGVLSTHREPALLRALHGTLGPLTDMLQMLHHNWHDEDYRRVFERTPLSGIAVFGEGSHTKGLLRHIEDLVRLETYHIDVWRMFPALQNGSAVPQIDWYDTLRFAPAIAAAREGLDV